VVAPDEALVKLAAEDRTRTDLVTLRCFATKQPSYARTFSSFLIAGLIVFVASSTVPVLIQTSNANEDNLFDDTMNELQQKINEKVQDMVKEVEGVRDGTRPPGQAGEKMDEVKELADLIDQIVESTESEYASDRITALGEFVKKLGDAVGDKGDQFKPLGEMISGMGEATVGMGGSLREIEEGRRKQWEDWDRGWQSPEQYAQEKKDRYQAALREAIEEYEESIENERKGELHPECPEECTDEYKDWEAALDELIEKRRVRDAAKEQYESAEEHARLAEGIRIIAEQDLAKARRDGAEYNIMEAENTLRAFGKEKVKEKLDKAKKELNDAQANVDKAQEAEEKAWSVYRDCVKKCEGDDDNALYIPGYGADQGQAISYGSDYPVITYDSTEYCTYGVTTPVPIGPGVTPDGGQ